MVFVGRCHLKKWCNNPVLDSGLKRAVQARGPGARCVEAPSFASSSFQDNFFVFYDLVLSLVLFWRRYFAVWPDQAPELACGVCSSSQCCRGNAVYLLLGVGDPNTTGLCIALFDCAAFGGRRGVHTRPVANAFPLLRGLFGRGQTQAFLGVLAARVGRGARSLQKSNRCRLPHSC